MLRQGGFAMTEELISKKELLETYKISYGALYRWKRMGLIPEDWFIKKSTVTGQETFFPRKQICERMEIIKRQKDDVSLEELSKILSSESKKMLVIDTVFGKRVFNLSDINSIVIENDNEKIDITNDIIGDKK